MHTCSFLFAGKTHTASAPYAFTDADFGVARALVTRHIASAPDEAMPWATLCGLVGEVTYGGRVGDAWDRRVVSTLLSTLFTDETLDGGRLAPRFQTPPATDHRHYVDFINENLTSSPQALGLHSSAPAAALRAQARELLAGTGKLLPLVSSEEHNNQKNAHEGAKGTLDLLLDRVPPPLVIAQVEEASSPCVAMMLRECGLVNALLVHVRGALVSLDVALRGAAPLSPSLEELLACLATARVPPAWARLAWPSLRPLGSWVEDLTLRHAQLAAWIEDGLLSGELPKVTIYTYLFIYLFIHSFIYIYVYVCVYIYIYI